MHLFFPRLVLWVLDVLIIDHMLLVSQQSTDHKRGSLVPYIDPYYGKNWSDSLPEKCLEEMNAKKQEIWESLQVEWQVE